MGKRILILDDDLGVLEALNEALSYENFDVRIVTDIDSFYLVLADFQPDLIMLDFLLNGINGGEICHQLKVNSRTRNLPVILMSAYPRVFGSLGNYGCDGFIAKPFDLNDLIEMINTYTCAV